MAITFIRQTSSLLSKSSSSISTVSKIFSQLSSARVAPKASMMTCFIRKLWPHWVCDQSKIFVSISSMIDPCHDQLSSQNVSHTQIEFVLVYMCAALSGHNVLLLNTSLVTFEMDWTSCHDGGWYRHNCLTASSISRIGNFSHLHCLDRFFSTTESCSHEDSKGVVIQMTINSQRICYRFELIHPPYFEARQKDAKVRHEPELQRLRIHTINVPGVRSISDSCSIFNNVEHEVF